MAARVLIVEDNPTNLALMAYLLRAFGHVVLMASDGQEALKQARADVPDVVLMDLQMPRMNGYEAARQFREDPALRRVPLVAVTAFAMVGDREKVLRAGFDGYIPKPIVAETFVSEIEAFIAAGLRSSSQSGVPQPPPAARARILVVDNTPANLELMRSTLEPFGYAVDTAATVSDALAIARAHPPDLILSDLHMPGQTGYDLIRVVKADSQLRPIPFAFLSSTTKEERDCAVGLSLGAVRFLVRPMDTNQFLQEIDACLRGTEGADR